MANTTTPKIWNLTNRQVHSHRSQHRRCLDHYGSVVHVDLGQHHKVGPLGSSATVWHDPCFLVVDSGHRTALPHFVIAVNTSVSAGEGNRYQCGQPCVLYRTSHTIKPSWIPALWECRNRAGRSRMALGKAHDKLDKNSVVVTAFSSWNGRSGHGYWCR